MTNPQNSTSTVLVGVSQLTSTPLPVGPYQFELIGKFQSASASNGIKMTLAHTSGASTAFVGSLSAQLTSSTKHEESFMSAGTAVTTSGVPNANIDYAVLMK